MEFETVSDTTELVKPIAAFRPSFERVVSAWGI